MDPDAGTGAARPHPGRASQEQGYDLSQFRIDWQQKQATCPQGVNSARWLERPEHKGHATITLQFPKQACADCPVRAQCSSARDRPRQLTLLPQAQHEALQQRRQEQQTDGFRRAYGRRAGIEGTISQAVRAFELRHTRYWGLAKTHLQHVCSAVALKLCRLRDWLVGKRRAKTRTSHFAALFADPAA